METELQARAEMAWCMQLSFCLKKYGVQSSLTPAAGGMSAAWHRWRQTQEQLNLLIAIALGV